MPIKKVKSKRYKSGYGFLLVIDRKDFRMRRTFEKESEAKKIETAINNRALSEEYDLPLQLKVTLAELIEEHLEEVKNRRHFAYIKRIVETFVDVVGADRAVRSLKKADLQAYIKKRYKDNPKLEPQSVNREMCEIKSMLNAAWKHFAELDEYQCPRLPRLREPEKNRSETWSDEEFNALLKALSAPMEVFEYPMIIEQRRKLAEMLIVMRHTGMRPGEARLLNRKDCDFKKRLIKVVSLKGGKPRTREIPMNEEVHEILYHRSKIGQWIFSNPDNNAPMTEPYNLLRTACERAGIAYGLKVPGGKIAYDTRRTFENEALDSGHTPHAVGQVMGHSVKTMVKSYLRTTENQKKAVVKNEKKYMGILVVETDKTVKTDISDKSTKTAKAKQNKANSKKKGLA
jgi:integrase